MFSADQSFPLLPISCQCLCAQPKDSVQHKHTQEKMAHRAPLNPHAHDRFAAMEQRGRIVAEYVWIGGSGQDVRSKARLLEEPVTEVSALPLWNYDGSSTGQAPGHDSEVILKPIAIFSDPFRGGANILVLCETYQPLGEGRLEPLSHMPTADTFGVNGNNNRARAAQIFDNPTVAEQKPWYGLEQEYTLFEKDGKTPLGWPPGGYPAPQGPYYCSAGVNNAIGREVADAHLKACLHAGVKLSGINAEVMPGQWEYQVGPCEGISAADHLWISRYIMHRVCEIYQVVVSFAAKPIAEGDWNGAGCHTNFSTLAMRSADTVYEYTATFGKYAGKTFKGGFAKIIEGVERLGAPGKPAEHIAVYGPGNTIRLTGKHETARWDQFSYGVADRGASIRIPRDTEYNGFGYLEDRRPAACADPYLVTSKIVETILLSP
eukprot:m.520362 g.520362  ORF g.520362 m.520362 type:complete len:433 (-) comp57495_c0_seq1:110-1408(-)